MAYATRTDIEDLWGADFLGDLLPDDVVLEDAVAGALDRASAEIDAHLSARYPLPLDAAPQVLVTPAVNIAVYMLANRHAALTTTIEDRYEQAIDLLKRIAEGKAGLGDAEPRVSAEAGTSTGGATFSANERLFGRDRRL